MKRLIKSKLPSIDWDKSCEEHTPEESAGLFAIGLAIAAMIMFL